MEKFAAKGIKVVKGRKVDFTIHSGTFSLSHSIIPSIGLFRSLGKIRKAEAKAKDDMDKFDLSMDLLEKLLGEENTEELLDFLAENAETTEEEAEQIADVITIIFNKVVPKLQASAKKA